MEVVEIVDTEGSGMVEEDERSGDLRHDLGKGLESRLNDLLLLTLSPKLGDEGLVGEIFDSRLDKVGNLILNFLPLLVSFSSSSALLLLKLVRVQESSKYDLFLVIEQTPPIFPEVEEGDNKGCNELEMEVIIFVKDCFIEGGSSLLEWFI